MASLKELGLSEYEARAYRSLLDAGPTTAKELSDESGVPMGRIYDVLKSIEGNDLVRTQAASRPKRYVAVDPSTALDRLLATRKRELDERAEQYETAAEELIGELSRTGPTDGTLRSVAVGPTESAELLLERISASESPIRVALSGETSGLLGSEDVRMRVLEALVGAVERGIDLELLVAPALASRLPPDGDEPYGSLLSRDRVSVRIDGGVTGRFVLFEGSVTVGIQHPLAERELLGVLDLTDQAFVADVETDFKRRWRNASSTSR